MFGYVRPNKNELKVKEFELYKSTYCGLCRVMGKRYSYIYKMSLNYDFVFMTLLRLYVNPEKVSFSQSRCIAHPTKKKNMMNENEALKFTADVGVIMLYHDLLDKINDNDGLKSILSRLLLPELKRLRKKACKNELIAEFDKTAEESLRKLNEIEKNNTPSVDMPAEEFGILLGEAVSAGLTGNNKTTVFEIGKNLGKWIYITDAADDLDHDVKHHSYNPLLAVSENSDEAKKQFSAINITLLNILSNADTALELIDKSDVGLYNILSNILRLGLPSIQEKILKDNNFTLKEKEFTE
ncbi:MAG: hypothetical protein IKU48_06145 [Clostridia bacterium]|nr:hypothetical protein [Clostridia bacterium]